MAELIRKSSPPVEDRFAKLRAKAEATKKPEQPSLPTRVPDKNDKKLDEYMRKRMHMMINDPEWHSHSRPIFEIPVNENLKFIVYVNPVYGTEIHFYRLGRKDEPNSWYSVGKFKGIGVLDAACKDLTQLMQEVAKEIPRVVSTVEKYARENPYDSKKYADVEAWLAAKAR